MAIDVVLQIDGIEGASRDAQHAGWIACSAVQWRIHAQRSIWPSLGEAHGDERAELGEIVFDKIADRASPALLQLCATGQTIPTARFTFMRADGRGERITYFEIALEQVWIACISPNMHVGPFLTEHAGLRFAKVTWQHHRQVPGA